MFKIRVQVQDIPLDVPFADWIQLKLVFCDIPEPYHISLEELIKVDKAAFNAGNFSCKLVNRLFPELFGPDHLRTQICL
jgi:hypothetical protein